MTPTFWPLIEVQKTGGGFGRKHRFMSGPVELEMPLDMDMVMVRRESDVRIWGSAARWARDINLEVINIWLIF